MKQTILILSLLLGSSAWAQAVKVDCWTISDVAKVDGSPGSSKNGDSFVLSSEL